MMSIDQVWDQVEAMNSEAYQEIYSLWVSADTAEDSNSELAESLREEASLEQAIHFRDSYNTLDDNSKSSIIHWLQQDEVFQDQFSCYYGFEEFQVDFLWMKAV